MTVMISALSDAPTSCCYDERGEYDRDSSRNSFAG
jgi:hypothetical protein